MRRWGDISEASTILGVSGYTLKRRAKFGQIPARKEVTDKGLKWLVEVPETTEEPRTEAATNLVPWNVMAAAYEKQITLLTTELEKRGREISELHILLQQEMHQKLLTGAPPEDYVRRYTSDVASVQQPVQQEVRKPKQGFWKRLFGTV